MRKRLSAVCVLLALSCFGGAQTTRPLSSAPNDASTSHFDAGKVYLWAESSANLRRLGTTSGVVEMLDKMKSTGFDTLILDVKPVHGHVIYPSQLAPRLKLWKGYKPDLSFDVAQTALREARARGIRVLLAVNVFSEGLDRNPDTGKPFGPVFEGHRDWEAWNFGMPDKPTSSGADQASVKPISQHGKSFAIFVTPFNPAVRDYELSIIKELATKYHPDGIILDRVRFNNIESDFSDYAHKSFEKYLGRPVEHWPQDILTWKRGGNGRPVLERGALFGDWLLFRALTIRDFFQEARQTVKQVDPHMTLGTYTGSWYSEYWNEGLNWGSPNYDASKDYAWAPPKWKEAGYANLLDVLFSGLYFSQVSVEDARRAGVSPARSVEGATELLAKVVDGATKYVGGLNLPDYKGNPAQFERAARMCLEKTGGLMAFDLVYLDEYGWWQEVKQACSPGTTNQRGTPSGH